MDHLLERSREALERLFRQAENQIDVDRPEAVPPRRGHDRPRLFFGLDAIHGALDDRIEILDSDRHPVEP